MFCPECGGEYREGFLECADCGVALVESPPPPAAEAPASELVTVYTTGDPAELAFLESVFRDAGIPCFKKGESVQDLFGMGRLGIGFNAITGPVLLQVPDAHAAAARELLKEVTALVAEESPEPDEDADSA